MSAVVIRCWSCHHDIKAGHGHSKSCPSGPGEHVGFLTVPAGVFHDLNHEVAAWSTKIEVTPGRYPVFAKVYSGRRGMYAEVRGVVARNYTPALYCGVRIGGSDGSERNGDPWLGRVGGGYYAFQDCNPFHGYGSFEPLEGADMTLGYGKKAMAS